MQLRSTITLLAVLFSLGQLKSQCAAPESPVLNMDYNTMSYGVSWFVSDVPACAVLYYEVEYSSSQFTPGMGEGTLISPVNDNYVTVPETTMYAWVRSVCDCEGGDGPGQGDGIADTNSDWVEAMLNVPVYPDPSYECGIVQVAVSTEEDCGTSPQEMNFIAVFSEFPEITPSCLTEPQYMLWCSFTAPSSGVVGISMSTSDFGNGDYWNDFGFIILDDCSGTELYCEASYSDTEEVVVTGLNPGENYVIGNWNNGFPYEWSNEPGNNFYNGTSNIINVCETSEAPDDYSLTPGMLVNIECGELEPQPEYTLGDSWGDDTQVTHELILVSLCGDTSHFEITATDTQGHTATATQYIIIGDSSPPEIILEAQVTIACDEDVPAADYLAVDICAGEITASIDETLIPDCANGYTLIYTLTATDECGNSSTAQQEVNVVDNVAPEFGNCPDTLYINSGVPNFVMPDLTLNTDFDTSDNCAEELVLTQSIAAGSALADGNYPIEFLLADNCGNFRLCESIIYVSPTVGVDEYLGQVYRVFPNPASDEIYIAIDSSIDPYAVSIYNLAGEEVMKHYLVKAQNGKISLLGLSPGSYVLSIATKDGIVAGRSVLVKE